ncbi:MAG: bifunctional demethylmenaquinone methyltransferase/2-methoxy-6-polyprenyl-1,4-benzoquinol methylase UbiE [Planctomycetota bacterium]|nr:bifunctional demethylmenaquinone methyltransferase/2-methoxy-6-polyprenyl-1,4-benzoquinol methylase UbiE [Planctomycetota bacterium]
MPRTEPDKTPKNEPQVVPSSSVPGGTSGGLAVGAPAWSDPELANPHAHAEKATKVRAMFSAIADSYDLNNRLHSLGRDVAWRNFAVKYAGVRAGDRVLDCACGTGDLSQAFAATDAAEVVGLDFTAAMLDHARVKATRLTDTQQKKLSYIEGDAMTLPFADASFDIVSIAFGIRNVSQPMKALAEFHRVLRPGGRLVVLEFDRPKPPMRWFNDFYCGWIMPRTATLISRDRSGAYKYLPKSVGTFLTRSEFQRAMGQVGFTQLASRALTFGICVCHRGVK